MVTQQILVLSFQVRALVGLFSKYEQSLTAPQDPGPRQYSECCRGRLLWRYLQLLRFCKSESIADDLECHRSSTRFAAPFQLQVGISTPTRRSERRAEMFGFVARKWPKSFESRVIRAMRGLNCDFLTTDYSDGTDESQLDIRVLPKKPVILDPPKTVNPLDRVRVCPSIRRFDLSNDTNRKSRIEQLGSSLGRRTGSRNRRRCPVILPVSLT